jgi:hypothetical protein
MLSLGKGKLVDMRFEFGEAWLKAVSIRLVCGITVAYEKV